MILDTQTLLIPLFTPRKSITIAQYTTSANTYYLILAIAKKCLNSTIYLIYSVVPSYKVCIALFVDNIYLCMLYVLLQIIFNRTFCKEYFNSTRTLLSQNGGNIENVCR